MASYEIRFTPQLRDLNPICAGQSTPDAASDVIGIKADHYVLHYTISGKGTFYNAEGAHRVKSGQLFLAKPGEVFSRRADPGDPYHLRWVSFSGDLSHHFFQLPPVFDAPDGTFDRLCDLRDTNQRVEFLLSAELMRLYAALFPSGESDAVLNYVQKVVNFIQENYMQPITVQGLANALGLHRGYLSRIFKRATSYSLREYILHIRLTNAQKLLAQGQTVQETAQLCGFNSVPSFCKSFKKYDAAGMTPLQAQKVLRGQEKQD